MNPDIAIAAAALALAAPAALLIAVNLPLFRPVAAAARRNGDADPPAISILIPARNEEATIAGSIERALASTDAAIEVVVADDGSTDRTAEIVRRFAAQDARVRLTKVPPLPAGAIGKLHACAHLASVAAHPTMLFVDADVRLRPEAAAALAGQMRAAGADLLSGFPRQVTGTFFERLIIPLIEFVLLAYLPLPAMRRSAKPSFAAGTGQLILVDAAAYRAAGGHASVAHHIHDGLHLPRRFRQCGYRTDLCNASQLAECRMYENARDVWSGFAKNAHEGIGAPKLIGIFTALLGGGQVLPAILIAPACLGWLSPPGAALAAAAFALSTGMRLLLALALRQPAGIALLHPVAVAAFLAIQWTAFIKARRGRRVAWRGREYTAAA